MTHGDLVLVESTAIMEYVNDAFDGPNLMPGTARMLGVQDATNPAHNIRGGARYLAGLLARFRNDVTLAAAAYNAGPGAVIRAGNKVPPYAETRAYVQRVMSLARSYRQRQTLQEVQS